MTIKTCRPCSKAASGVQMQDRSNPPTLARHYCVSSRVGRRTALASGAAWLAAALSAAMPSPAVAQMSWEEFMAEKRAKEKQAR